MFRKYYSLFSAFFIVIGVIISIYILCRLGNLNNAYKYIWLWPLSFSFFIFVCCRDYNKIPPCHLFGLLWIVVMTLTPKYYLYPMLVTLASPGYIGLRHITLIDGDIQTATLMAALELVLVAFLLRLYLQHTFIKERRERPANIDLRLKGSKNIYFLYFILAIVVYFMYGRSMNVVQFLVMDSLIDEMGAKIVVERTIYDQLIKYIVSVAIAICALISFDGCKRKYKATGGKIYIFFAIFTAMVFTGCIIGESRGTQIALGLVMCLILSFDYPKKTKSIFIGVGSVLVVVVLSITFARTAMGIVKENSFASYADTYQIYDGGPESLAQNIKVLENKGIGIGQMIFDYLRSCFPLNLFMKSLGHTTSQIYNISLYGEDQLSGHIVFSSSYSQLCMGYIGLPITMFIGLVLALKASKYFYYAESYEMKYLAGYCFMRLSGTCLVNTPSNLSSVTQYICTFGLLFLVAYVFNKKKMRFKNDIQLN